MSLLQKFLISIYAFLNRTGVLNYRPIKKFSTTLYFTYKKWYEDPFFQLTRQHPSLFRAGHILDVGACLGYTSILFSRMLHPGFKVYSFEPNASNFFWLKTMIHHYNVHNDIEPIQAAVGEKHGIIDLWQNDKHFGDHRIATRAFQTSIPEVQDISQVNMWSIDEFVQTHQLNSAIAFIKIDVQGYELPACQGMEQTLKINPDVVIAIEYAPDSLLELGFEPQELLRWFHQKDYCIYILERKGHLKLAEEQLLNSIVEKQGYVDLICSRKKLVLNP